MRIKVDEIEVIVAFASCSKRATHSGTGDGSAATTEIGVVIALTREMNRRLLMSLVA